MLRYEHGGDVYAQDNISLDFSVNTNPMGMPDTVKQALVGHLPEYARYPDPSCRALRAALGARHGTDAGMILCGNGASELILALCACLRPQRTLVTAPAFSEYERSAALFGGQVLEHRLSEDNGFALTEGILRALSPDVQLLFLCTPNNPTGRLIPPELVRELARACRKTGARLVLDECFIDFTHGESLLSELEAFPNLLILRAFTKIYAMAGLRLGTLYSADKALLLDIARFRPTWSVSGPAQAAGLAALRTDGWLEETRRLTQSERTFLSEALREIGLTVYPSDANFLLIRSDTPLFAPLRRRGILVRSCANFTGLDERYIRVGLKTREENTALLRAVSEVLCG